MPNSNYLRVSVDGRQLDLDDPEKVPVVISYKLEDPENFEKKKSSEAFDVKVPATLNNDQVANTFHNPGVEDLTPGRLYKSNRAAVIEANGQELLVGKAFLKSASHDSAPIDYTWNFYGANGDWLVGLKESTLYDFIKHLNFLFTKQRIIDSWAFNGRNEQIPYVFAPVRYGLPMEKGPRNLIEDPVVEIEDYNMLPVYMKPSLSVYWILYWGFKSLGYRIESNFFNTDYFRRMVMPWTWGNFLYSDGTKINNLKFLARSVQRASKIHETSSGQFNLDMKNDYNNGGFDNNGTYTYDDTAKEGTWTYLPSFDYGVLEATFHLQFDVDITVTNESNAGFGAQIYKTDGVTGVKTRLIGDNDSDGAQVIKSVSTGSFGKEIFQGIVDYYFSVEVKAGDKISVKYIYKIKDGGIFGTGSANLHVEVTAFELAFTKIVMGGTIDFENYEGFKKYKFLDMFRGIVDLFNLSLNTDSTSKVVVIEPTHPYSINNSPIPTEKGYFNGNSIDWASKQDLLKTSNMDLFSDYEREVLFKFKDDSSDGIMKVIQDRNIATPAAGKFVFPDRFKSGKKEMENRFFSPVAHYNVSQWGGLGSDPKESPQMIAIVPENISNTSRDEAQNTFAPKIAWYKGIVSNVGWRFDNFNSDYPYMFAVNYKPGGENDPILSYTDERIGKDYTSLVGMGLLKRFFLQRLAIMRNGDFYSTFFKLDNNDVTNWFHREHIICRGQKWELVEIKDYNPLVEESTPVSMRMWSPVTLDDLQNVYPSLGNVSAQGAASGTFEIKYCQLLALASDIPLPTTTTT